MRNSCISEGSMALPSTLWVGSGQERNATVSLVITLMSFITSGLGLSGTWGGVFLPQATAVVRIRRRQAVKKNRVRIFIASFS
jgi:hypothetical protein